jgi:phospholipid/cholesterol/gamma-HCH transport system substrate-binding protein
MQRVWRSKRLAWISGAASVAGLLILVVLGTSAGGSNGTYRVRAIFDDAGNIIPGEDVKIDGVRVGAVGSVTPTPEAKASVVLEISNPGFEDFREDASCIIRPQSLIGEKFVDCLPTQPRPENTPEPPALKVIPKGQEGAGERLLPVTNTSSPVDTDLLNDINRLPEAQRLRIILNELGATFAGRGSDLHEVVLRADPALQELNKVLSILVSENHVLVNLAEEGDKALIPLTAVREKVADFIVQSNTVAKASALHRGAIAKNFQDFPPFLEELGPAMERFGKLAEQTTPTFSDLNVAAPGLNKAFTHLAPFSESSDTFFKSFGKTAKISGPALKAAEPLLGDLEKLGTTAKPFGGSFSELFTSLRETGGLERIMDFIFLGAGASNGYDALGHFLRAEIVGNNCVGYKIAPQGGCSANFINQGTTPAGAATATAASTTSLEMQRTLAVINGASPSEAIKQFPGKLPPTGAMSLAAANNLLGEVGSATAPKAEPVGGSSAGTTYYTPTEESSGVNGALLNYLLGN